MGGNFDGVAMIETPAEKQLRRFGGVALSAKARSDPPTYVDNGSVSGVDESSHFSDKLILATQADRKHSPSRLGVRLYGLLLEQRRRCLD
nr:MULTISPECIES: hypothetical protein [Burkholderia cepacia complex]